MAGTATKRITERIDFSTAKVEDGFIRGAKLLGFVSLNKRRYTEASAEKAKPLYEGATIYVDHPANGKQSRSYFDRFGRLENVTLKKGEGLFGDIAFNPKHVLAEQVKWDAEHNTPGVGFSHNIVAGVKQEKGGEVIEEISKVHSVDLVDGPATTKSLFEQQGENTTVKEVIETYLAATADLPKARRECLSEMMSDPVMGGTMMGDSQQNPDEAIKAGMRTAVMAAFDDPSLDAKETLDKIEKLLAAQDAALGKEPPSADAGSKVADALPPPVDDSAKDGKPEPDADDKKPNPFAKKAEQFERRAEAMEVLATFKIAPKPELVKELCEQAGMPAMKTLVAGWSEHKRGGTKPSIKTLFEGRQVAKFPDTHEEFVAALKRR